MPLRTGTIALGLGTVLFCALGCEEPKPLETHGASASVVSPAVAARPTNNRPGNALPPPSATTRPGPTTTSAPASAPVAEASAAALDDDGPIPIRKRHADRLSGLPATKPAHEVQLNREQTLLFDALRQKSLKLQMQLDEVEERNLRLTQALVESRDTGRRLQDDVARGAILQEIHDREVGELKDQVVQLGGRVEGDSPASAPTTLQVQNPADPAELQTALIRRQRENEKLRLQLKLSQINAPDKMQKILVKLGETVERAEDLEQRNRKLSRTIVRQEEDIQAHRRRENELQGQIAEHGRRLAAMEREMKRRVAGLEMQLVQKDGRIAALQNSLSTARDAARPDEPAPAPTPAAAPAPAATPAPVETPVATAEPAQEEVVAGSEEPSPAVASDEPPPPSPAVSPAARHVPAVPPAPTRPITGRISTVKDLMVMIDIGQDAGLEEGMRLIVYRKDVFIGYLRVEQIGKNESACTFTRQIHPAEVGDNVIDRIE